jgi:hypothetical protein
MRLQTITKILPLLASAIVLASCQKEISAELPGSGSGSGGSGGNSTANIAGDYDFVGISAHTVSTVNLSQAGQTMKTVTVSDYVSQDNTGTVKITSNQMIGTNVGYSVDTTMNNKTYLNGLLIDDSDLPFTFTAPPTSSTSTYVRNSADSITMTGSLGVPDPSGNNPTGPVGTKLSWHGDTLYMKINMTITQTINQGGVPATMTGTVNGVSKLKKH